MPRKDIVLRGEAMLEKDLKQFVERQKWLADAGDPGALYNMGVLHLVDLDEVQARKFFEKAAAQGHESAQARLDVLDSKRAAARAFAEQEDEGAAVPAKKVLVGRAHGTEGPPVRRIPVAKL